MTAYTDGKGTSYTFFPTVTKIKVRIQRKCALKFSITLTAAHAEKPACLVIIVTLLSQH